MRCHICAAEEATVHVTKTTKGESLTIDLCDACAVKMGLNDSAGFSLKALLSEVKSSQQRRQEK